MGDIMPPPPPPTTPKKNNKKKQRIDVNHFHNYFDKTHTYTHIHIGKALRV